MTTEKNILTPIEAISEFYKLKDKYETTYHEKYINPILKAQKKTLKEKRVEYSKLPKSECINCKRNVGTIFSIKTNLKEGNKNYIAKCGDLSDPCPLDINIIYNLRDTYEEDIKIELKILDEIKLQIIKNKNDALFYEKNKDAILKDFESLTEELKHATEVCGYTIEKNILNTDNPVKRDLLKKTQDEFGKGFLLPFKTMVNDFLTTGNDLVLNQAVNFYVSEMIPKLKEIQELKYEVNFIEYDEEDYVYKLIQRKNSLQTLENFVDDDKVVSFVKGLKGFKKTGQKTLKERDIEKTTKTRKNRKIEFEEIEIQQDNALKQDNALEQDNNVQEDNNTLEQENKNITKEDDIEKEKYTMDTNGNVLWKDRDYNEIWLSLNPKYRQNLSKDTDWMIKTMKILYSDSKNPVKKYKPKEFILPDLVYPIKKSLDGKIETGNEIINDEIKNLTPFQIDILNSVLPEEGQETENKKDYNKFEEVLSTMIKQNIGFSK
jgi:hypothetical protein